MLREESRPPLHMAVPHPFNSPARSNHLLRRQVRVSMHRLEARESAFGH